MNITNFSIFKEYYAHKGCIFFGLKTEKKSFKL